MPGKRFKAEEIVNKLRQADVELARGSTVAAVCKLLGITDATYFRWRSGERPVHPGPGTTSPR
jgi:putative transposase